MSELANIGKAFVRDVDSQVDEIVRIGLAEGKAALGEIWDKEPELRKRYEAAIRMGARGSVRMLAGETLPFDYWEQPAAQFANTNLQGAIIAERAFRKAALNFIGGILNALSGLGGPAVKAAGDAVSAIISKIG